MFWKKILFQKIQIETAVAYISFSGLIALALVFPSLTTAPEGQTYFKYLANLLTRPLLSTTYVIISAVVLFFSFQYVASLIPVVFKDKSPFHFFSRDYLSRLGKNFAGHLKDFFYFGLPPVFGLYATANIMGSLNSFNIFRLMDGKVLAWDKAITGAYPFSSLANVVYPEWLITAVRFSFLNLPTFIIVLSAYIFFYHRRLFREFSSVFCLSLLFLVAGWQFFPVLSPQDRFIDNVYNLPSPPSFASASVSLYAPQASIQSFLREARADKEELGGVMPTSTLPSAHVVWAIFFVYYAYRTRKIFLFAAIPLAFLSTAGTVLFAQHYFIDIPSAILLAALSIFLIRYLKKFNPVPNEIKI